jgi:hypothetical protein
MSHRRRLSEGNPRDIDVHDLDSMIEGRLIDEAMMRSHEYVAPINDDVI